MLPRGAPAHCADRGAGRRCRRRRCRCRCGGWFPPAACSASYALARRAGFFAGAASLGGGAAARTTSRSGSRISTVRTSRFKMLLVRSSAARRAHASPTLSSGSSTSIALSIRRFQRRASTRTAALTRPTRSGSPASMRGAPRRGRRIVATTLGSRAKPAQILDRITAPRGRSTPACRRAAIPQAVTLDEGTKIVRQRRSIAAERTQGSSPAAPSPGRTNRQDRRCRAARESGHDRRRVGGLAASTSILPTTSRASRLPRAPGRPPRRESLPGRQPAQHKHAITPAVSTISIATSRSGAAPAQAGGAADAGAAPAARLPLARSWAP